VILTLASLLALGLDIVLDEGLRTYFVALGLALLSLLLHIVLALAHKCPECGKHPTIQGFAPPHPSVADDGDNAWVRVVRDFLKKRAFTCFHCGSRFSVSDAA
jgi:hypothetical protein